MSELFLDARIARLASCQVTHLSGVSGLEVKAFNASELPCRGQQLYALGFSQFCE
jgi:hypothetical protein